MNLSPLLLTLSICLKARARAFSSSETAISSAYSSEETPAAPQAENRRAAFLVDLAQVFFVARDIAEEDIAVVVEPLAVEDIAEAVADIAVAEVAEPLAVADMVFGEELAAVEAFFASTEEFLLSYFHLRLPLIRLRKVLRLLLSILILLLLRLLLRLLIWNVALNKLVQCRVKLSIFLRRLHRRLP